MIFAYPLQIYVKLVFSKPMQKEDVGQNNFLYLLHMKENACQDWKGDL